MNEQKKINLMLIALFVLLAVAILIVVLDPTKKSNQYDYNGFVVSKFRFQSAPDIIFHGIDLYVGSQKYNIPIRTNPVELESIPVSGIEDVSWLKEIKESDNYDVVARDVYLTFNPNMSGGDLIIAGGEIIRVLGTGAGGVYKKNVAGAFTSKLDGSSTPVKTCSDANKVTGIIILELGSNNKVYAKDDCVVIQGKSYPDLIRSSDRFLLALLGVIK